MYKKSKQKNTDRTQFRFPDEVQANFDYLITEYGFLCTVAKVTFVRYESDRVFINIYHGRFSYEIGLEVGPKVSNTKPEEAYSLSWLIELVDAEEASKFKLFVATTPELVVQGVSQLAKQFKRYSGNALEAGESTFSVLARQQEAWKESYAMEVLVSQVKPRANEAFHKKKFGEAARLYESIRSELSKAELKKLKFAQQHSS